MRLHLMVAVFAGFCVVSCDEDDHGPQELVTYTMEVDANWWLFASDPDGNLLDSKQLIYKQPVSLTALNPPDSFSMTFVRVERTRPLSIYAVTYTGIKPDSDFAPEIFHPGDFEDIEQDGKVTIQITNYPIDQALPLIVSDQYQSTTYNSSGGSTPTFLMSLWRSKARRFLVSGYNADMNHPVYAYIDAIGPGTTATVDFSSFVPFDKTIEIKGFQTALTGHLSFTMSSGVSDILNGTRMSEFGFEYTGASPVAQVGYLDDFSDYFFDFRVYEIDEEADRLVRRHKYTHEGPITNAPTALDDNLHVNSEGMTNFAFVYSGNFQMRTQEYSYQSSDAVVAWVIYSAPGGPTPIIEVPAELTEAYPQMDPNTIPYYGSRFYSYDDGYTYGKYIQDIFSASYGPEHPGYEQAFPKQE